MLKGIIPASHTHAGLVFCSPLLNMGYGFKTIHLILNGYP